MIGKTTLSSTHRLHSELLLDRIYVVDQGTVVKSGTYEELMQ
jgi:ABC-type multidrug transport system fused ATPase/permease subunit